MEMPPLTHLRAFAVSNGIVLTSSAPSLLLLLLARPSFTSTYASTLARMAIVVFALSRFAKARQRAALPIDVLRMCLVAAPIETAASVWALRRYCAARATDAVSWSRFVPLLLGFELVFDFFHYAAHRIMHAHPQLYVWSGHKAHHANASPVPLDTYCQHPVDVVLSNALPMAAALHVLEAVGGWHFSPAQLHVLLGYKTFTEVAGHVGDNAGRATCFPLCVYLPRALHIELRTRDHDWHHSSGGRANFSKRFTLWDKLFGTFEDHVVAVDKDVSPPPPPPQ